MTQSDVEPPGRNARCRCGSGLRYKACCATEANRAGDADGPAYPGWERLSDGQRRQLRERLRQALQAQSAGRLEMARDLYRDVLAQAPDTFDALHMLGVICFQSGELAEAQRHLRRALELTDWRVEAMRHNFVLVADAALIRPARNAADGGGATVPRIPRIDPAGVTPDAAEIATPLAGGQRTLDRRSGPLLSVLVSTFNAADCLPACLMDLERQTIADATEIIVIDSGSEQDERAIARAFEGRFRHFVYLRTARETLHAAWNRGIALARGEYVTNANTDDAHRRDAFALMVAALDANREADFAYCDYAWTAIANPSFDDPRATRTIRHQSYHPAQALFYCVLGCHPVWRRSLFDDLGGFDPHLRAVGDYELLLRAVAAGRRPVHIPEVLSLFYQNPAGLTFQSDHAERELGTVQSTYRARMPIDRLYDVAPERPAQAAAAWNALGVLATGIDVPWLDAPHVDLAYAVFCFRQALNTDATHAAALANLAAIFGATDNWPYANALLERLPGDRAREIAALVRDGRYAYEGAAFAAAVAPLRYSPNAGG